MKIDLTELLQKVGNEAEFEQAEEVSYPEDALNLTQPVKINLHLINTGTSVLVGGTAETEVELECSRCLKKYKLPVKVKIDEEFARSLPPSKRGGETELQEKDFVYPLEKDNTIDISEAIRQNLLLTIPMKTLCRSNCEGLPAKG